MEEKAEGIGGGVGLLVSLYLCIFVFEIADIGLTVLISVIAGFVCALLCHVITKRLRTPKEQPGQAAQQNGAQSITSYATERDGGFMNKKYVPKDLKECYEADGVSASLWNWSEWLQIWGARLLVALCVIGVIAAINSGIETGNTVEKDTVAAVISAVFSTLVSWALYAVIEFFAYQTLALLVAALASLVQHTKITAGVALYRAAKDENYVEEYDDEYDDEEEESAGGYFQEIHEEEEEEIIRAGWTCRECGSTNPPGAMSCRACGVYK